MDVNMDVTEIRELVKTGMKVVRAEPLPVRPESAGSVPVSDGLLEMWMERDPAKWAAHQIATKGYGLKTVGEAMDMIEAVVREAIKMEQNRAIDGK